ncbi:adenosine receptor A2a-like [Gigantopelta aegis]|uniref:adenosine receptor A2a-like n=1 Tax=Gigantopelta aegis TaxID=1735272 RepID=UPI001B88743D|nr:adenosine receptor A2a-like [Gigantopelta aegis]
MAQNATNDSEVDLPNSSIVMLSVFVSIFTIPVILIGNGLTIVCVWRTPNLKTLSNMYIVSLAVADFLTGCFIPLNLSVMIQVSKELHFNEDFCLMLISGNLITVGVSVTSMILIAVDRYLYIVRPLHYATLMTTGRTRFLIAVSWVVSGSLNLVPIFHNNWDPAVGCAFFQTINEDFLMYYVCLYFWTGSTISAILYGTIFRVAWRQHKTVTALYGKPAYGSLTKANWQRLKLFFVVFGIYFVCWLPLTMAFILGRFFPVPRSVSHVTITLIYVNSSANCFVYALMNREFKQAMKAFVSDVKGYLCFS